MVTNTPSGLYDGTGGILPLDFINTVDRTVGKPWVDRIRGYDDLLAWSVLAGTLSPAAQAELLRAAAKDAARASAVLARARELREALYRVFAALVDGSRPAEADLAALNRELELALSRARVERTDDGFAWTWQTDPRPPDAPLWPLARSAAELLTSPERALIRRCASSTCLWLFLDRTKNHRRRWCDMKVCGNRAKVRRYRNRTSGAAAKDG